MMAMIVLVLTVWYAVCALLVRPFGIRVPVIIWKKDYGKAVRNLSRLQYAVLLGVLTFGVGTPLGLALFQYIEHLLGLGDPVFPESLGELAVRTIWFMLWGGFMWGVVVWKHSSPNSDPLSADDAPSITPKQHS